MKVEDKIIRAKVHLQKENPFFAYLVMNMKIIEDSKNTKSMGVDEFGNLYYNSKWIDKLSNDELKGVLSHEVLHIALEHLIRGRDKEHEIYNISADLVINYILKQNKFELPVGLIPDYHNEFKFSDKFTIKDLNKKSAEEVYNEIMKNVKFKKVAISFKGFDNHIYGDGKGKGKGKSKSELRENKKKWNRIFSEASVYSKQQGKLPDGINRLIDIILNEKVNWKSLLYKYITRELPYDYTYNRPSKKSRATGIYMPSVLRENINIVVAIDTSGSIGQKELSEFLGEIINISKSFNNINMKLIVCDSEIKDVYDIKNGSIDTILNLKIKGGGGTSHIPVYDYLKEKLPNTKFVINFTDGFTSFPEEELIKTIWVLTKNSCDESRIPFGEVIKLED